MKKPYILGLCLLVSLMIGCSNKSTDINKQQSIEVTEATEEMYQNAVKKAQELKIDNPELIKHLNGKWVEKANTLLEFKEDGTYSWYLSKDDLNDNIQQGNYWIIPIKNSSGKKIGNSIVLHMSSIKIDGKVTNKTIVSEMAILEQSDNSMYIKDLITGSTYTLNRLLV